MRKLLIASLAAAALSAVPASAQYQDYRRYDDRYGYGGGNIVEQLRQIDQRIARADQRGRISRNEARRLPRQVDQIDPLYDRYRRNGLTRREVQELRNRIQNLRQQLRWERQDGRWDDRRWD